MRFGHLALGAVLILVAIAFSLTSDSQEEPRQDGENSASLPESSRTPTKTRGFSPSSPGGSTQIRPKESVGQVENLDLVLDQGPSAQEFSAAERQVIAQRATRVKAAALAKLSKMTKRLRLTGEQREKIFPHLVQSTSGYHPAMVLTSHRAGQPLSIAMGDSGLSTEEAIHEVLDPEQQEKFIEDLLNKQAWWNEIITQWEDDFDSAAVAGTAPGEPESGETTGPDEASTPAPPRPFERGNIFDQIK